MCCTGPTARNSPSRTSRPTRRQFNEKECCDPVEGMDYQSRNCAIIYTNRDDQIQIYSRAHGDAFAYVASLDRSPWAELFARITGVQTVAGIATPAFSEDAIALVFTARHLDEVRYTAKWGQWHLWDGQRWAEDRKRKVFSMARTICREVAMASRRRRPSETLANNKTKMGVLGLAMDDQRTAAVAEQWDADIWQLCTPGGMVDLQTGKLRPALPGDYCTMMTAVAPGGTCPLWHGFPRHGDRGRQGADPFPASLLRLRAHRLDQRADPAVPVGPRRQRQDRVHRDHHRGDGRLSHRRVDGRRSSRPRAGRSRHPTDMAGLRGARLVTAAETEQGRRWAEIEDQDDDRRRQDHGTVHAAGFFHVSCRSSR